ncbi:uncharacterized protein [Macrobrachium rosenbergii]|uniref:uncharacterized protein n=1 Tax=Macrobrachium rosenbergii TaxID=79674 RepID=UPI0034D4D2E3
MKSAITQIQQQSFSFTSELRESVFQCLWPRVRVRQIRDFSNVNQWKYISTDLNPADVASRGVGSVMSSDMTHWLEGPDFLIMPASECPAKMHPSNVGKVTEEDFMSLATTATSEEGSPFMSLITHFSRWERLKRAVAVFIAFLAFLRNKEQTINLRTTQIMQKAEKAIVCFIQKITFASEVENLNKTTTKEDKREHSLPKTSTIFRLDPVLIVGTQDRSRPVLMTLMTWNH